MLYSRPSLDEYFISMLRLVASRATCPRRQVGAIIADEKGHLVSTGYNGVPSGMAHCIDEFPCPGTKDPPGNTDNCWAIHAEANAILQAGERIYRAHVMYCTTLPCFVCSKLIANTGIDTVIYLEDYADHRGYDILNDKGVRLVLWEPDVPATPPWCEICGTTLQGLYCQTCHEALSGRDPA